MTDPRNRARPADPRVPARSLLSLQEAADEIGVCVKTLRRWIADGRLVGYRVGPRAIRVDADELRALARPLTIPRSYA